MQPCRKCGCTERNPGGDCPECTRIYQAKWRLKNREKVNASNRLRGKKWRDKNKEQLKACTARYRAEHADELRERSRKRFEDPEKRRLRNLASDRWRRANLGKAAAKARISGSFRYGAKVRGTPKWADRGAMHCLYQLRNIYRDIGVDAHVDHIVPLRSEIVCGLHVEHNLQLITGIENSIKGNRTWPDMPTGE